jgi:ribosome biogenesis protein MAK21
MPTVLLQKELILLHFRLTVHVSYHRVMAFLKRLGICALTSSAPITAGLLFLTAEVYRARPNLLVMLTSEERLVAHGTFRDGKEQYDDDDGEDSTASHQLGNFEASKREPSFAVSGTPAMWETSLLRNHFHPSVRSFSTSVLEAPHLINFAGDPTTEFSLSAFLNRFAYKNPKKQHSEKMRRPQPIAEEPLNAASFLKSSLSEVAPDKIFFHKFFGEKAKLLAEGKSRDRSKRKKHDGDDEGDESDGDDDGVDFDEKAIDKYATKLAEDMLRDNEDDADIDDDFSDFDDDVEDKEDFSIGSASDEDESDGEEDFNGSETLKGGKEDAYDSEGDSEIDSLFSEEEEDDLALAFSEGGPTSKNGAKSKNTRGKRKSEEMSDFASAEDYEETMEQIVDRFSNGFDRPNDRVPISDVATTGEENKKRKNSKFVPVVGQKIKNPKSKKMKAK